MAVIKLSDLVEKLNVVFDDNKKLNEECECIVKDIEAGTIKLFQIMEQLGSILTSRDISIRKNGMYVLSRILNNIDKSFLNEEEIDLLSSFYCDRLRDHNSVIPDVIQGFLSIVQMTKLTRESILKIFHNLFNEIRCQSEIQEIRFNIYQIIKLGLSNNLHELKLMGPDFVYGIVSSMDGESDPRNLIQLFDFLPKFIREFHLGHLTEEMFEVLACYFPVDFNSAGMEGCKVTREDLAQRLEACLCSTSVFGEFCLPLLVEKLDSNVKKSKIDSLSLLARGSSVYGSKILEKHVDELWPLLRNELLPGTDQELKAKANDAIDQIIITLADNHGTLEKFINRVFVDLKSSLTDVQLSLYGPSIKVLESIAKADKAACICVLKIIIPLCLGQYSVNTSNSDKIHLITTFNDFINIAVNFGIQIKDIAELTWTDLPGLYLNELNTIDLSLKSKIIEGLSIQKCSLTKNQREIIYNKLTEYIDNQTDDILINTCYKLLTALSKEYPHEVLELINNQLKINCKHDKQIRKNRLEALAAIAKLSNVGPQILPIFIEIAISNDSEMRLIALNCIKSMLETQTFEFDVHHYLYKSCQVLTKLLSSENMKLDDKGNEILIISQICKLIIRKLSEDEQKCVIEKHCQSLKKKVVESIELLEGLCTPLIPCNITNDFIMLIESLVEISIQNIDENIKLSSCKLISTLINKITHDKLERILNIIRELITNIVENESSDLKTKYAAVVLNTWCTKALITGGCPKSQDFLDYQLNILKNEAVGEFAGTQFRIFVDKNDSTLTEDNYCTIKLFYKQRIFQNVINQNMLFVDRSRKNYLTAFVYLAEEMPQEILLMHLSKIVPLLIESLSLDSGQLILSTLHISKFLLETKHIIFIEQIQSFISMCLKLTTYPNMNVRIASHDCLHSYCNYPTVSIKPYKDDVLEKLSEAIDDKKRLVRKSAVITRTRWFLVGSPGEPE